MVYRNFKYGGGWQLTDQGRPHAAVRRTRHCGACGMPAASAKLAAALPSGQMIVR